jgi:hypothetical protein
LNGSGELQKFDLHPALRRAKNELTKAFVNSPAVSAIDAIASSSMIAYVAAAAVAEVHPSSLSAFLLHP